MEGQHYRQGASDQAYLLGKKIKIMCSVLGGNVFELPLNLRSVYHIPNVCMEFS